MHWLILFNSFLAKQLNIVCSINRKLLCPCVQVCSAKTTYVSDSANFVAPINTAIFSGYYEKDFSVYYKSLCFNFHYRCFQ